MRLFEQGATFRASQIECERSDAAVKIFLAACARGAMLSCTGSRAE